MKEMDDKSTITTTVAYPDSSTPERNTIQVNQVQYKAVKNNKRMAGAVECNFKDPTVN